MGQVTAPLPQHHHLGRDLPQTLHAPLLTQGSCRWMPTPWWGPLGSSSQTTRRSGQLQMDAHTLVETSWKLIPSHSIPGPSPFPTSLLEASLDLLIMVLPVQGIPLLSITLRDGAFWESVKKIPLWFFFFIIFKLETQKHHHPLDLGEEGGEPGGICPPISFPYGLYLLIWGMGLRWGTHG